MEPELTPLASFRTLQAGVRMHRIAIIACLVIVAGCNTEIEQDRNCRRTTDGWVCRDDGVVADDDMSDEVDDLGPTPDASSTPDLPSNPTRDMPPEEDVAPPQAATSCAELLLRGESTGRHTIELVGNSTEVYCDMDTEGGGWMMVARSVAGGAANSFGWRNATGSLDDMAQPYALAPVDFEFTEALVGAHDGTYGWGNRVYRLTGLGDFWANCQTSACNASVTPVAGNCNEIVMLNYAGFNDESARFFFRDLAETSTQGLHPDGFQVFYDDCRGGELQGQQGMIFVR